MDLSPKLRFEQLYSAHEREIVRYVGFRIADVAMVEDIASQVFVRLWEKVRVGESIEYPRALLFTMARSLVIDEYRKKSHRRSVPIEGVDESVFSDDTDTTVDTETALTHKKVLAVVRTLKAEYQDVIFMHYVEEMPVRAIADQLQENENAVRVRLHRALASVRKLCTV